MEPIPVEAGLMAGDLAAAAVLVYHLAIAP